MSHEERLPQCEEFQCRMAHAVEQHISESVPVRADVEKHTARIETLMEARLRAMEDISKINMKLSEIDAKVSDKFHELKIWILLAAISGLIVVIGQAFLFGGKINKLDDLSTSVHELQEMHPRMSK